MKIILVPTNGSAMLFSIEGFNFDDGELRVRVSATPLESSKVLSTSPFTTVVVSPVSLLGPDPIPDIAAWLVGSDGPYKDGVLVEEADVDLTAKRMIMLRDVRLKRDALQSAGATTPYGLVDTDDRSIAKLTGSATLALALGEQYQDIWTMADGTDVPVDAAKMMEIGLAAGQHVSACQRRKKALEAEIKAAETIEDLEALDLLDGWPAS